MRTISILILLALTACSSNSNDSIGGRILVAPGGYEMWNCAQMDNRAKGLIARQKMLEDLMAKAGQGLDGRLIGTMTYQPEYTANRGELDSLRRTVAAKNCPPVVQPAPAAVAVPSAKKSKSKRER